MIDKLLHDLGKARLCLSTKRGFGGRAGQEGEGRETRCDNVIMLVVTLKLYITENIHTTV